MIDRSKIVIDVDMTQAQAAVDLLTAAAKDLRDAAEAAVSAYARREKLHRRERIMLVGYASVAGALLVAAIVGAT